MARRARLASFALVLSALSVSAGQGDPPALAPALERYLSAGSLRLSPADRRRLHAGHPLARLQEADGTKEVAVVGVVWINAPIAQYVAALKNIETFETGASFRKTRRISVPPRIEDFADLALTDEDVADLARCRVGACDIKLTDRAIETFQREVDWRRSEAGASANVVLRQVLVDYLRGYLEGGNGRLAVYRDRTPPTSVGHEIATLVDSMPALSALPDVRDYLLNFPRASLPDSTSMLYWQETAFGLKPTHRLSHLVVRERADEAVVASKMLYATHYFWTALELRLLVADPSRGSGFWFLTAARSRMDGLTGFTGFFVRRRVRSEVLEGTQRMLVATRRTIERRADTNRSD